MIDNIILSHVIEHQDLTNDNWKTDTILCNRNTET